MRFEIKGLEPMGCVRMTQRSKFVDPSAKKYLSYKQVIYTEVLKQLKGVYNPLDCAIVLEATFYMPIPKSWPKYAKEEAQGAYCTTKPDADNILKGLLDALNGLLWEDDNRIVSVHMKKKYAENPGIVFSFARIGELSHGQGQAKAQKEKTKQAAARKKEARTRRNLDKRV